MKSIIAAIAALAVAVVSAQTTTPVSITSPLSGSSFKAGGQATITWINPTTPTLAQVQLAKGPATALQPVGQVATNVNTADGKLTWTIPANTPVGSDYAFELGASPNIAYSGFFSITAADGTATNSTSSGSASSGSAASSGSSSMPSGAASSGAMSSGSMPSGAMSSGAMSSGSMSASGSMASASASSSAKSGASTVKAGIVGAAAVAGAAAFLF